MATSVVERVETPPSRPAPGRGSLRLGADRLELVVALLLGGLWFCLTTWIAFARHDTFQTGRYDLEIYTQVVWNTAHGRPFETTLLKTNLSHLAEHVALVLFPIAALYRLIPDPKLLLAIQQLALALLGLPLFVVARRVLNAPWQAVVVLACFYLSPALAGVALDDFHAVPIAALPLAVGLALVLLGRPRLGAGVALLGLLCEEETALFLIGFGGMLWLRRERRLGVGVAAISAAYLGLLILVVMPSFHDDRTLGTVEGNRTLNHFQEIREAPSKLAQRLTGERMRDALAWVGYSTGGLPLLSPTTAITAVPTAAALFLQNRDDTFGRHWVAPLVVGAWFATALGLARLPAGPARHAGLALLLLGTAVSFRMVSPLPGGGAFNAGALEPDDRTRLLQRAVDQIPDGRVVVASPNIVAHLANRPEAYVFPIDSHYAEELGWRKKRPDFYALDLTDELTSRAANSERLNPMNADKPFHVWTPGHKVVVLTDDDPAPMHRLDERWADRLLLKGYDVEETPEGVRVTLYWERYAELRGRHDRDLRVTNRLAETMLYQRDMELSTVYGSNKWRYGQTIRDEIQVPPPDGPFTMRIAWVSQDKRSPFKLADGSDAFELTIVPGR